MEIGLTEEGAEAPERMTCHIRFLLVSFALKQDSYSSEQMLVLELGVTGEPNELLRFLVCNQSKSALFS